MSRFRGARRGPAAALVAALVLCGAAACGSGATEGPDEGDDAGAESGDEGRRAPPEGEGRGESDQGEAGDDRGAGDDRDTGGSRGAGDRYSWSIPGGDLSLDSVGDVFNTLKRGDCAEAESKLDLFIENEGPWPPTRERLYRAAIAVCAGDAEAGGEILGDGGITVHGGDCRLYKAIRSVVDQVPQESVACPAPVDDTVPPGTGPTAGGTGTGTTDVTAPTTGPTTTGTGPTSTGTGSTPTAGDTGDTDVTG